MIEGDRTWSAFNPSIAWNPDTGYAIAFRSSNYVILETGELHVTEGGKIRNQVWFTETNENLDLLNLRRITIPNSIVSTSRGVEDPKLFWRDGHWHFTATMLETHTPVARLSVCKMDETASTVIDVVTHGGVDAKKPEKNWMVPDLKPNPNFDFIYGPNSVVRGSQVIHTMPDADDFLSGLRGGGHMLEQPDGSYITVMHKLWTKKTRNYVPTRLANIEGFDKNYGHYFVRFDSRGRVVEMSHGFQFIKRGIEFCSGLTSMKNDFIVTFGREDVAAYATRIPKQQVFQMLKPV